MATSVLPKALSKATAHVPRGSGKSHMERFTAALESAGPDCTNSSDLVPVLMLFMDDEAYCTGYLPSLMHAMAIGLAHYGFRPRFYFYDNSTDGTPQCLERLARTFDVRWRSEPLPDHVPRGGASRSSQRCNRIAACRNALLGFAVDDVKRAKLVLMADSNIFAGAEAVMELVRATLADATVGLATACTNSGHSALHYYDTYALWPCGLPEGASVQGCFCPMRECRLKSCVFRDRAKYATLSWDSAGPMQVWSAFAGLAAGRPRALLGARWRSQFDQCEHVAFCRDIRAAGRKVVIVPTAQATWADDMKKMKQETLRQLLGKIRAPPGARAIEKMWSWRTPKTPSHDAGGVRVRAPGRVASKPAPANDARAPAGRSVSLGHRRVRVSGVQGAGR